MITFGDIVYCLPVFVRADASQVEEVPHLSTKLLTVCEVRHVTGDPVPFLVDGALKETHVHQFIRAIR